MNKTKYFIERAVVVLLLFCLFAQVTYIIRGRNIKADAQVQYNDGRGGESAPPPPGQIPDPPRPGQGGHPPGMSPRSGGVPGARPGGRVITYPSINKGRDLTELDKQKIESRYTLHRWVLSDLLWSLVELEKSKKYKLTDSQVKKIYPSVKKLARSVEVVEKSNKLMEGLLTAEQKEYIEKKLKDREYIIERFLAPYSPDVARPTQGITQPVLEKCKVLILKRAKGK
ncbi:MAG: hypothetical protein K8T10_01670 [Candidatus Eremiobacteraeota bacterium]|nr:hypothetical protein [Candidatus Eremiobacteraeota bacterium]